MWISVICYFSFSPSWNKLVIKYRGGLSNTKHDGLP